MLSMQWMKIKVNRNSRFDKLKTIGINKPYNGQFVVRVIIVIADPGKIIIL